MTIQEIILNRRENCGLCGLEYNEVRTYTYALQELLTNGINAEDMLNNLLWFLSEGQVKEFATSRNYCYLPDFEDDSDVAYWLNIDEEDLKERKNNE